MVEDTRRARLQAYMDAKCGGSQAELAQRLGISPGRVSQILKPGGAYGEKIARRHEKKLRLGPGYLDREDPPGAGAMGEPSALYLTEDQRELLRLYAPLLDEQRDELFDWLGKASERAKKIEAEIKRRGLDKTVPDGAIPAAFTRPPQRDLPIEPPAARKPKKDAKK